MSYFTENLDRFLKDKGDDKNRRLKKLKSDAGRIEEIHSKDKSKIPNFHDKYWMYSLFLYYHNISKSEFEEMCKKAEKPEYKLKTVNQLQDYIVDEGDRGEAYKYVQANKDDTAYIVCCEGNAGVFYNLTKHMFFIVIEDWTQFEAMSYDEFKNKCKSWLSKEWPRMVEADKLYGYNILK